MSIIIKGMKMPDSCLKCQIKNEGSDALYTWGCPFTGLEYTTKEGYKRQDECPLVEIPEGARLIDAKQLKKKVLKWMPPDPCGIEERERPFETDICVSMLMEIDEAPIVFEED